MKKFRLSEIEQAVCGTRSGDAEIKEVCIDSRIVKEGSMYVAIQGERFDGHDFINSAVENGAAAVLCSKKPQADVPYVLVKDTKEAFLALANWYRSRFSIPIVAVTGSVGKTTTKDFVASALSALGNVVKTQGNLNNEIGVPRTLFTIDDSAAAAVVEMGMDGKGQISALSKCAQPDAGVITNIGVSHIENLGSRDGILSAKLEIRDGMLKNAPLIINGDDPYLLKAKAWENEIITFGITNPACSYRAVDIKSGQSETEFTIAYSGNSVRVTIPTVGMHNVSDATAAFAVAVHFGVNPQTAAGALSNYTPSGMRQRMRVFGDITFIEDCYNASPDSMRASINTLCEIEGKRKIAVLGDMLELGSISESSHKKIGAYAAKRHIDCILTMGEMGRLISENAHSLGVESCRHFDSHSDLADYLASILSPGDVVSFKASHGMSFEKIIELLYEKIGFKPE